MSPAARTAAAPALPADVSLGFAADTDLRLAMAVQRQMLPARTGQLTTLRYAAASAAAAGLGGDYYDFVHLGGGALGIVMGDVSGKGLAAALLMSNLQASIRCECARGIDDLPAMLARVNMRFFETTLPGHYATLFFGEYDDRTRRLTYVNCAQQPAMIVRRDGSVDRLETTALPLGLVSDWTGETKTVEIGRGETVCICSDGIVEAGLDNGFEFGEERLRSFVAANARDDIEFTVARVAQAARVYGAGGPADDMTVVGLRGV